MDSSRYTIDAKAENATSTAITRGPMMQLLLEERFKLKIHRATKSVPVYELKVAKGGPKLQPAQEGSCVVIDRTHPPVGPLQRVCGGVSGDYIFGTSMANFTRQLSAVLDRDVIDKTGIVGTFDIHLQGTPLDAPAVSADGNPGFGARVEASLPKLGLKLEAAERPGEFIVIDHVERPDAN